MAIEKIGMMGLVGHIGTILNGVKKSDTARVTAVASTDEAAIKNLRESGAAAEDLAVYADYNDMLAKEDLDLVGICNFDSERAGALIAACNAGLPSIPEKPAARTLEEFDAVRSAVEKSGVEIAALLTMRTTPLWTAAKKVVADGDIGDVVQISGQKSYKLGTRPPWMCSRETFSGVIPFIGIHLLDLARWISERDFVEGFAYGSTVCRPQIKEMEDNAGVLMRMDNGGTATLRIDYLRPQASATHGDDRLRFAGSKGVLEVRGTEGFIGVITEDRGEWTPELPAERCHFSEFVAFLEGKGESPVPTQDYLRATEVCLLAREAQDQGKITALTR